MNSSLPRSLASAMLVAASASAELPPVPDHISAAEGYAVEYAAVPGLSNYPMFMELDYEGNLYIAESSGNDEGGKGMTANPKCFILKLSDSDDDGVYDTKTIFAEELGLPMGVLYHEGSIFVADPPHLVRFEDTDDDGVADVREVLLSGWNVLNTASLHGPFLGPDGWLYLTHGRHGYEIETKEGEKLEGLAARIWRCRTDGTGLERVTGGGFDNPVELIFTEAAEMIGTMTYFTDPKNGQRDALLHFVEGAVYPKPHHSIEEFVRTGHLMPVMTKFARIAPAGLMRESATGDLYSAQFNPHRVQRHKLFREGDTFRTEDSDFLVSTDTDFHPCDVIEDADGSILVCDTGGWYVDACPVSRVSRPEAKGGIFRVRKADAPVDSSKWGRDLDWAEASPELFVARMNDTRPRVRARAMASVIETGPKAAPSLLSLMKSEVGDSVRANAFWSLVRIGGPRKREAMEAALIDASPSLRGAAAHMAGLERDAGYVAQLRTLLNDHEASVRLAAATALGRIKSRDAVEPLLASWSADDGRFEDHAIIYALIQIGDDDALFNAFNNGNAKRPAYIALDQLNSPLLTANHTLAMLRSDDPADRDAGLMAAARRPEWSPAIATYLDEALATPDDALREIVLAYAGHQNIAEVIAKYLNADASNDSRLFLLNTIGGVAQPWPETWIAHVNAALTDDESNIRNAAIDLVQRAGTAPYRESLRAIAADESRDTSFRLEALRASLDEGDALNEPLATLAIASAASDQSPTLRQAAASVLTRGRFADEQRAQHVETLLSSADALTFGAIVAQVSSTDDADVWNNFLGAVESRDDLIGLLPAGQWPVMLASAPASLENAAAAVQAKVDAKYAARVERLLALHPRLGTGDVGRGRRIFFGEKAACGTCHQVGADGGTLGPDLTTIGLIRSGEDLLEAVLFPSASLVQGYETIRVSAKDADFGDIVDHLGVIEEETSDAIVVATGVDQSVRLPRDTIESMAPAENSLMPEGLDQALSEDELIDLVTFLQSLNNHNWLLPNITN